MSTTRRSFLKALAGVLVAGPVVVKTALAKQPEGESYYGGTFAEVALREMRIRDYRGIEVVRMTHRGSGYTANADGTYGKPPFVPDPYSLCALATIHELERQNPGKYLKPIAERELK